jgi:hypothetical protein
MKLFSTISILFSLRLGAYAQEVLHGNHGLALFQHPTSKISFADPKTIPSLVPLDHIGKGAITDTLDFQIVGGASVLLEDIVYTMPIKGVTSDSRMPIHVPNPEINYTILEKKLGGIIREPKED